MTGEVKHRALVVGFGSIGARHSRVLENMGCKVSVVSSRAGVHADCYTSLEEAISGNAFTYAVLANETSKHIPTLKKLLDLGFLGKVLVEKPLCADPVAYAAPHPERVYVGYNLRFDPILLALKAELEGKKLITAEIRACSYLPDWRAGRDYRQTESAKKSAGGGVLRDLSHELDYSQWLFGGWKRVAAMGGHLSTLEIQTDDVALILMETAKCAGVTISMNYLDRIEERWIVVNTEDATYRADLMAGSLVKSGKEIFRAPTSDSNHTYVEQHKDVLDLGGANCCSYAEGVATMKLLAAVERAQKERQWVSK